MRWQLPFQMGNIFYGKTIGFAKNLMRLKGV